MNVACEKELMCEWCMYVTSWMVGNTACEVASEQTTGCVSWESQWTTSSDLSHINEKCKYTLLFVIVKYGYHLWYVGSLNGSRSKVCIYCKCCSAELSEVIWHVLADLQ